MTASGRLSTTGRSLGRRDNETLAFTIREGDSAHRGAECEDEGIIFMGDLITAAIGFLGVVVGATVGFIGIRWQHNAQKLHEIRSKGADLIFLGDQHREAFSKPIHFTFRKLGDPTPPPENPREKRVNQMSAIVRYLELVATKDVYQQASKFRTAAENLSPSYPAEIEDPQLEGENEFVQARDELLDSLKR